MPSEFDFFQQWYPVSPIEDLDPHKPTPIKLLGQQFVIWKSGTADLAAPAADHLTATYFAVKDECPHRLAPLSEGRIDEQYSGHN